MSQFGTIGTPRMHPCVAHASCGQYNATDIMLTSAGLTRVARQKPNLDSYELKCVPTDVCNNIKPSGIGTEDIILEEAKMRTNRNETKFVEEVSRRYVEVSPGVWSY